MKTKDELLKLKIQNLTEGYNALLNGLGPNHFATLMAEYNLGALYSYVAKDKNKGREYLRNSYYGLLDHEDPLTLDPWTVGFLYVLTLDYDEKEILYVSKALIDKYPQMLQKDTDRYLILCEFIMCYYNSNNYFDEFDDFALEVFPTIKPYLDPSDPRYILYLFRYCLALSYSSSNAKIKKILKQEKEENTIDGKPLYEIFDSILKLISLTLFNSKDENFHQRVTKEINKIIKSDEFIEYNKKEVLELISALPVLDDNRELILEAWENTTE